MLAVKWENSKREKVEFVDEIGIAKLEARKRVLLFYFTKIKKSENYFPLDLLFGLKSKAELSSSNFGVNLVSWGLSITGIFLRLLTARSAFNLHVMGNSADISGIIRCHLAFLAGR